MRHGLRCLAWRRSPLIKTYEANSFTFTYDNEDPSIQAVLNRTDSRAFTYGAMGSLVIPILNADSPSTFTYSDVDSRVVFKGSEKTRSFLYEGVEADVVFKNDEYVPPPTPPTPPPPPPIKIVIPVSLDVSGITVTEGCSVKVAGSCLSGAMVKVYPEGNVPDNWVYGVITPELIVNHGSYGMPASSWYPEWSMDHPVGAIVKAKVCSARFAFASVPTQNGNTFEPRGYATFSWGSKSVRESVPFAYSTIANPTEYVRLSLTQSAFRFGVALKGADRQALVVAHGPRGWEPYYDANKATVSPEFLFALLPVFSPDSVLKISVFGTVLEFALATATREEVQVAINQVSGVAANGGIVVDTFDVFRVGGVFSGVPNSNLSSYGTIYNGNWVSYTDWRAIGTGIDSSGLPTGGDYSVRFKFTQH